MQMTHGLKWEKCHFDMIKYGCMGMWCSKRAFESWALGIMLHPTRKYAPKFSSQRLFLSLKRRYMEERWKSIKDCDGYFISNRGRIKSSSGKVLSPYNTRNGYKRIKLKFKNFYVHRLVAEAFVPNPKNLPQVNHINGDKSDNSYRNIEWIDNSGNMKHMYATKTDIDKHWSKKPVLNIDTGERFESITDAARRFRINKYTLSKHLHKIQSTAGGCHWIYATEVK